MANTDNFFYKIRLRGENGHIVMCISPSEYKFLNNSLVQAKSLRKGLEKMVEDGSPISDTTKEDISYALGKYGDSISYQFVGKYKKNILT